MKKIVSLLIIMAIFVGTTYVFALTDEQRAVQRRQQEAAQRAYEAQAEAHNDEAAGWQQAKDVAEDVERAAAYGVAGGVASVGGPAAVGAGVGIGAYEAYREERNEEYDD